MSKSSMNNRTLINESHVFLSVCFCHKLGSDRCWEEESAQIRVMVDPVVGSVSRPILVLSCVSRETADTHRIPCVTVADQLQLSSLSNPWMVRKAFVTLYILSSTIQSDCNCKAVL